VILEICIINNLIWNQETRCFKVGLFHQSIQILCSALAPSQSSRINWFRKKESKSALLWTTTSTWIFGNIKKKRSKSILNLSKSIRISTENYKMTRKRWKRFWNSKSQTSFRVKISLLNSKSQIHFKTQSN
jgi:hypothetical protein